VTLLDKRTLGIIVIAIILLGSLLIYERLQQTDDPGAASEGLQANDTLGSPIHSKPGGFYDNPFKLSLEDDNHGGQIRYTVDGSEPSANSMLYDKPIDISNTTVIRSRIIDSNKRMGPVVAHTYFVQEQATLPVMSIIASPELLWSETKGIYVLGKNASKKPPYRGANYWEDREIPIHLQLYEDKLMVFQSGAGMKIFGGESRALPQKSLALYAKKKYGAAKFEYRFFSGLGIQRFDSLVLRNSGQDFAKTHFLDGLNATLLQGTGLDVQAYRPVVVYLNGQYWGIHDLREKITTDFLADHHGINPENIDLLESGGTVKAGDADQFHELMEYVRTHDLSKQDHYEHVQRQIDIDNFILYEIAEITIANQDWPDHNIRYWRPRQSDGRWKWIVYDTDQSFGDPTDDTLSSVLDPLNAGYPANELLQNLMKNESFRERFLRKFAESLNDTFRADRVISAIREVAGKLEPEMERHLNRWGGSMEQWKREVQALERFAEQRPREMVHIIRNRFNLSADEMKKFGFSENRAGGE